ETAVCGFDSTTRRFLNGRAVGTYNPVIADKNAEYEEIYQINIDQLTPMLATPDDPMEVTPVSEHEGLTVNLVVLGTSNNGRFDDLRVASEILKGKQVHEDCRLLVYPSSRTVYLEALKKGLIRVLVEAGAVVMYPGYGGLLDINSMLASGERALATTNHSRVSSAPKSSCEIFLCSPATAAASALNGVVTDPTRFVK
ncbi:MAG TPA: aconitase family protein, partial [candidate division Zixibacteria bacterium]|nr:aconitase family protein [candidate division Zixibacteria bacterium]